jgi:hypothetical protein
MLALIPVKSASDLEAEAKSQSDEQNQQMLIQGLAAHCRKRWEVVRISQRPVQERMLSNTRRRRLEYAPEKMAEIKRAGGSEIYMGISSTKCRAATSWLRDTLLGTGADKPWALDATPIPDLPPEVTAQLQQTLAQQLLAQYQQGMQPPDEAQLRQLATEMKDAAKRQLKEEAEKRMDRMELKMEDQLIEGGFGTALSEFLDDLATFPFAVLKGPVVRRRKTLAWQNNELVATEELRPEWERVDPFYLYWAPWANDIQDGYVIERHRLTREDLQALIGVEGYSEASIRAVLSDYDTGSLHEWLWVDTAKVLAEGKYPSAVSESHKDLIEALQIWDSVQGKMLIEWGMSEDEIEDASLSYPVEVWLIGNTVIKATLNYDPLGRKPYFVTSYEKTPGSVDGNGVVDLAADVEDMCNASARALANNMGIASGPQVGVNISRLPAGEDVTQMYPWKLYQFVSSDYGDSSPPISFFQPNSNAQELMAVYERFSGIADEVTGIPRYMTGDHGPGAGRTSSGLSMLISNAGKSIKQVITNIDKDVITQIIDRLYQYNQRYKPDPDLIGDVRCVAKGAMSLVVKEAEQVRRTEFLNMALQSPVVQNIMGMGGIAELLRDSAKNLSGNVDRIIPDREYIGALEQAQQQMAMMQQQMMQMAQALQSMPEQMSIERDQSGAVTSMKKHNPKNMLPDGSQVGGRESNLLSSRPNGV